MRNRPIIAAIALSVLLVTAGCSAVLNSSPSPEPTASPPQEVEPAQSAVSEPNQPSRTIKVGTSGQVQTQPDQAILRVSVEASGQNASLVRHRLADNVSRMRAALAELGIDDDQIVTTDFDIRNQERYRGREDERPAVWGRHAFSITLTDLNRTGTVIVTAVENGVTNVEDVRFTLSAESREELRQEALADAMDDARAQAGVIAGQADLEITGVGSVQTAEIGYRPVRFEAAALAGDAGGAPTTIEGGSVTVTAQVQVTYNATEA